MDTVQTQDKTPDSTFVGGIMFADEPHSKIQTTGRKIYPTWPFLSQAEDIQALCAFLFTTTDLHKAAKDFLDAAESASKKIGYVSNYDIIVDAQNGKVSCIFNITATRRKIDAGDTISEFASHDFETRRSVGNAVAVSMIHALEHRGHRYVTC